MNDKVIHIYCCNKRYILLLLIFSRAHGHYYKHANIIYIYHAYCNNYQLENI